MRVVFRGNEFSLEEDGGLYHEGCPDINGGVYEDEDGNELYSSYMHSISKGTAECEGCGAKLTNRAGNIWKLWKLAWAFKFALLDEIQEAGLHNVPCRLGYDFDWQFAPMDGELWRSMYTGKKTWAEMYRECS